MPYISVHVDVEDVIDDLSTTEIQELMQRHLPKQGLSVPEGMGEGDATAERIIERAFLAAKRLPQLPREIADLFWRIHGRAI